MKILLYCPNFQANSRKHHPTFLSARVKGYLDKGHNVTIVSHEIETHDFNYEKLKIIKIEKSDLYEFLKLNYSQFDIFVVHFITFRICKFLKNYPIKTIIFFHGTESISARRYFFDFRIRPYYLLKKIIYNFIHFYYLKKIIKNNHNIKFVPVSKWMKDTIEEDLDLKLKKNSTEIISNPVSNIFNYQSKTFNGGEIKILVIKNFNSYKYAGDITLEFINKILKEKFSEKLVFNIYGQGNIKKSLRNKLKSKKNVNIYDKFLTPKEIKDQFKNHDVFLYLTRMDAQSVSISEALSSGLPVISSNNSAIPEYIKDYENGYLIDNNNYKTFKNRILDIINDTQNLDKINKNNQKFEEIFSENNITNKEINLFNEKEKVCKECLCDTSIPDLEFTDDGICHYCVEITPQIKKMKIKNSTLDEYEKKISELKNYGKNREYDCIIGISGGVDSSYVTHLANKKKLKPLLIHFDNGWNSELAISNIKKIASKSNFDLKTYVINWEEFKDIQKSFLKAGVVDIELVTDHAIFANLVNEAKKNKIKYILSGNNFFTENGMPLSWIWRKTDFLNIKDIHSKYGKIPIKTFPRMNIFTWYLIKNLDLNYKIIELLNFIPYSKIEAIKTLEKEYDWKQYDEKHYESLFTKLYQSYILPKKFKIDKRIVHYSALIRNQELTRQQASNLIKKDILSHTTSEDIDYFLKKLDLSSEEFDKIIHSSPISHYDFKNSEFIFKVSKNIYKFIYEKNSYNTSP